MQEAFFNPDTGLGFFSNRLKTINKSKNKKTPNIVTQAPVEKPVEQIVQEKCVSADEVEENLEFLQFADPNTQKLEIEKAMEKTFSLRRQNPEKILEKFPRFLDTPNLVHIYLSFSNLKSKKYKNN